MVIEKDTIVYFSGTGNSFKVAKDISNKLGKAQLNMVGYFNDYEVIDVKSRTFGIVFPVYYARLPLIVEEFVKKLKISKDTYVFATATHGGGPASVLVKLDNILHENGGKLNSGFLLHMPGNNIFSYGPTSMKKQNKIFIKEELRVKEISEIINQRKNTKCELSKLFIDRIIDKIYIRTTNIIMDNLKMRDTKFWVTDRCNGCKFCEKICPVNNIRLDINKPVWNNNCEQCTACIQYCPKEAIQWGEKTIKRKRYRNPNVSASELIENINSKGQ